MLKKETHKEVALYIIQVPWSIRIGTCFALTLCGLFLPSRVRTLVKDAERGDNGLFRIETKDNGTVAKAWNCTLVAFLRDERSLDKNNAKPKGKPVERLLHGYRLSLCLDETAKSAEMMFPLGSETIACNLFLF